MSFVINLICRFRRSLLPLVIALGLCASAHAQSNTDSTVSSLFSDNAPATHNLAKVDDSFLLAIPEPSQAALLGVGIGFVLWRARRSERP